MTEEFIELKAKADDGCNQSQVAVGLALLHGQGVEKNEKEALGYFAKSAQGGNPHGCLQLSLFCLQHKQLLPDEMQGQASQMALNGLATAAEAGITLALYNLGLMFVKGDGVAVDLEKARVCFDTGAQAGDADCQCEMAIMLSQGEGGAGDPQAAFVQASKAAASGSAKGQFLLGCFYAQGVGTTANEEEALRFLGLSASNQYQPALDMLTELAANQRPSA